MKRCLKEIKKHWKVFVISLVVVYFVAAVGSIITSNDSNITWYNNNYSQAPLTPPNFVFIIVWNILFFLITLSLFYAWTSSKKKDKPKIAWVFGANLLFNMLWSIIFFGLKKTGLAFLELIVLWISVVMIIFVTWNINRKSAYLLLPYLLWISFAGVLNYIIAYTAI